MALRVFGILAEWTTLDDASLRAAVEKTGARVSDLAVARRLFARAVETPGGLKIQTIHAFCERILHLFPFEANVAASFEVLTEEQKDDLMQRAKQDVLGEAMRGEDHTIRAALERVAALTTSDTFDGLLRQALGKRGAIAAAGRRQKDELRRALAAALGSTDTRSADAIRADMTGGGIPQSEWERWRRRSIRDHQRPEMRCAHRQAIAAEPQMKLNRWLLVFLTGKGEPRKNIVTGKFKSDTALLEKLASEQQRLIFRLDSLRVAEAVDRSEALTRLCERIVGQYERMKQARGLLDFDNLISRTLALLSRADAAQWVLFKLDAGVDHVLVDEAQDTSDEQWSILEALTEEFFAGDGASRKARTFFAVGDEKQSIFSFQGANVQLFAQKRRAFGARIENAGQPFRSVNLDLSFRSAIGVLGNVDLVFETSNHRDGVTEEGWLKHTALKKDLPALSKSGSPSSPSPRKTLTHGCFRSTGRMQARHRSNWRPASRKSLSDGCIRNRTKPCMTRRVTSGAFALATFSSSCASAAPSSMRLFAR